MSGPAEWIMGLVLILGIGFAAWAAWMFQEMTVGKLKPRPEDGPPPVDEN